MFPFFFCLLGHICFMSRMSRTKIQTSESWQEKIKKTSFKLDTAACCCFVCLVFFKYRLLDLLGSVQHLIHRLQWKPRICVLIISIIVSASVSEHPCQFERRAALRILLRNRREDAVKVTTLHNLTHRIADLGC